MLHCFFTCCRTYHLSSTYLFSSHANRITPLHGVLTIQSIDRLIEGVLIRAVDEPVAALDQYAGHGQALLVEEVPQSVVRYLLIEVAQVDAVHDAELGPGWSGEKDEDKEGLKEEEEKAEFSRNSRQSNGFFRSFQVNENLQQSGTRTATDIDLSWRQRRQVGQGRGHGRPYDTRTG